MDENQRFFYSMRRTNSSVYSQRNSANPWIPRSLQIAYIAHWFAVMEIDWEFDFRLRCPTPFVTLCGQRILATFIEVNWREYFDAMSLRKQSLPRNGLVFRVKQIEPNKTAYCSRNLPDRHFSWGHFELLKRLIKYYNNENTYCQYDFFRRIDSWIS